MDCHDGQSMRAGRKEYERLGFHARTVTNVNKPSSEGVEIVIAGVDTGVDVVTSVFSRLVVSGIWVSLETIVWSSLVATTVAVVSDMRISHKYKNMKQLTL